MCGRSGVAESSDPHPWDAPETSNSTHAVERAGAQAVWFERFGGRDDDPEGAYLAEVGRCTVYVGILGERFGRPLLPERGTALVGRLVAVVVPRVTVVPSVRNKRGS